MGMSDRAIVSLLREHPSGVDAPWIADRLGLGIRHTVEQLARLESRGVVIDLDGLWFPTDGAWA